MTPNNKPGLSRPSSNLRVTVWYTLLCVIFALVLGRLFYLQIIKHEHYRQIALADQQREYSIPAQRGTIKAQDSGKTLPLVLNEKKYTLYADPVYIKDVGSTVKKLAAVTGQSAEDYQKSIEASSSRYVVLAKRLSEDQNKKILDMKLPGVGLSAVNYRAYPQDSLAAQLLGFVNEEGRGSYGIEQALNTTLAGQAGRLKATTDAEGVPLAASPDNVQIAPRDGQDVILTIELGMQKQLETVLKAGLDRVKSTSGSVVIIDPDSGQIKAMANYPTYNPAEFYKVEDQAVFNNAAVASPLEVGSVMKVLTVAAGLDLSVIKPDTAFYDPGHWKLDDHEVTNIEEVGGPGTRTITQVLDKSINTGAVWLLMQMGGQTGQVNKQARERWHSYMAEHFRFGQPTGVEQGYESGGTVPDPLEGYALELAYANTSFGQAMTATPLQMAAALSSVVNGGTYYQPQLVDSVILESGDIQKKSPQVLRQGTVANRVSKEVQAMMSYVVSTHNPRPPFSDKYIVGGKTGTAQIANPKGGYFENRYNGTYIGFVGGDRPQYVVVVRVNEPKIGKYAGSAAAQPIFWDLAHMLINNFNVQPKSQ